MSPSGARRPWLAILALLGVFAFKLGVLLHLGHHPLLAPTGDVESTYDVHFANQIAHGDPWLLVPTPVFGPAPTPFLLPPLYLYVLALTLKVSGASLDAVKFLQILPGTVGVWLIAVTADWAYGRRAAWYAGAIAALYGVFTFYEVIVLSAGLDPFLAALDLFLLTRAVRHGRATTWLAAGAALGLHALNNPSVLIVFAGLALVLVVRAVIARRAPGAALAFVLAGLVVVAPATLRNWRAAHTFVPISASAGLDRVNVDTSVGNGPSASPTGATPTALARNLRYALSATFVSSSFSMPFFTRDIGGPLSFLIAGPTLFVPLGLIGFVVTRRTRGATSESRSPDWPIVAYALLTLLTLTMSFVAARQRIPLQVSLIVAAGAAVAWMVDQLNRSAWLALGTAVASAALMAVLVAWPTGLDDGRTRANVTMGLHEIQSGRAAAGEAWLQRALARGASPGPLHLGAGRLYESVNQPIEAMTHYRQALTADPNDADARYAIGQALFTSGKDEEAIAELRRVQSGTARDHATQLLVLALSRQGRRDEVNQLIHTIDPSQWPVDQARGFALALADVGRVDLSIAAWARAAEAGGDAHDYERLGLAWAVLGRPAQAVTALARAVQVDPASATIRLNYAVALATAGRLDEARREGETALKLDPGYDRAAKFLEALTKK